jgi:hypothetical protein
MLAIAASLIVSSLADFASALESSLGSWRGWNLLPSLISSGLCWCEVGSGWLLASDLKRFPARVMEVGRGDIIALVERVLTGDNRPVFACLFLEDPVLVVCLGAELLAATSAKDVDGCSSRVDMIVVRDIA